MTDDQQFIDAVRRSWEEQARFFSNAGKPERERWVVREFLSRLGLEFSDHELESQPEDNPVDVVFREAHFQVKEIKDPAEPRHAEVKQLLKLARQAVTPQDLVGPVKARDIVLADLSTLILEVASSPRYPLRVRATLDLLLYVTRPYAGFNEPYRRAGNGLGMLGWRSISCLFGQHPLVLVATSTSPPFLHRR